jgi:hypothetical protein
MRLVELGSDEFGTQLAQSVGSGTGPHQAADGLPTCNERFNQVQTNETRRAGN